MTTANRNVKEAWGVADRLRPAPGVRWFKVARVYYGPENPAPTPPLRCVACRKNLTDGCFLGKLKAGSLTLLNNVPFGPDCWSYAMEGSWRSTLDLFLDRPGVEPAIQMLFSGRPGATSTKPQPSSHSSYLRQEFLVPSVDPGWIPTQVGGRKRNWLDEKRETNWFITIFPRNGGWKYSVKVEGSEDSTSTIRGPFSSKEAAAVNCWEDFLDPDLDRPRAGQL